MNSKDEYLNKIQELKREYTRAKQEAAITYLHANNKVKKGDTLFEPLSNHYFIVDKIGVGFSAVNNLPYCIYSGPKITKRKIPFKNGARGKCTVSFDK